MTCACNVLVHAVLYAHNETIHIAMAIATILRYGSFPVEVLAGGAPDGGLGAIPAITLSSLLLDDDDNTGSNAIPGTGLCISPSSRYEYLL